MAGFLDKTERVIDMVLTPEGKRLLSRGELEFCFFRLFDDEVDYDPFVSGSGSMQAEELKTFVSDLIESTPIREAVSGYSSGRNLYGYDTTNVSSSLFSSEYFGGTFGSFSPDVPDDMTVKASQRKVQNEFILRQDGIELKRVGPIDVTVERQNYADVSVKLPLFPPNAIPLSEGTKIRVFRVSDQGYVELHPVPGLSDEVVFGKEIVLRISDDQAK